MACSTAPKPEVSPLESSPSGLDTPVTTASPSIEIVSQKDVVKKPHTTKKPSAKLDTSHPSQAANKPLAKKSAVIAQKNIPLPKPIIVEQTSSTGNLADPRLNEVSGLAASINSPGVLYAVNDSGDSATLYAISENGQQLGQWAIKARNRDWEDLDTVQLNNQNYVLIGDTGDNQKVHRKSTFYIVAEPLPGPLTKKPLTPYMTINFVYEDGPRNVEAFAVQGRMIYLVSKEPISDSRATASRLYALEIPLAQPTSALTATFITELPLPPISLESKLAASFAGVDLNHITSLDMASSGRTAYLLTYREVLRIDRKSGESWSTAFQRRAERMHHHSLAQAEALTIAQGRSVFFTSEKQGAPLWSIPIPTTP